MTKRLRSVTCDVCNKVMTKYPNSFDDKMFLNQKTKRGQTIVFCSLECKQKMSKHKPKESFDASKIISLKEAAEFITESNAIEEIHLPFSEAEKGWVKKQHKFPEIKGQVRSLNYVLRNSKKGLNIDVVEKLHRMLMKDLLLPSQTGIRTGWVRVGRRLCPSPIEIRPMLTKWCDIVNSFKNPSENDIWQSHLAFEFIHPFLDGNGRSGRLFWLWLRYKHGFGYGCVYNSTKHSKYYPQFDNFNMDSWLRY